MKKVLMTAATLVVLLSTGVFAQRYGYPQSPSNNNYPQQPGYNQPGYNQPGYNQPYGQSNYNYDFDDSRFDRHLNEWDRELNLTHRQEREIRRIHDRFMQQTQSLNARDPRQRDFVRQARQRQFIDMMAVLGPEQRDRVIAQMRPYELQGGPRSANRGRGNYNNGRNGQYGY